MANPVDWTGNAFADATANAQIAYATGVFWRAGANFRMTFNYISRNGDGLGQTLLLSENLQAGPWNSITSDEIGFGLAVNVDDVATMLPVGDSVTNPSGLIGGSGGPLELQSGFGLIADTATGWPDSQINAQLSSRPEGGAPRPSSLHPGIVNAVFCDGSGRALNETMSSTVYAKMLTPNGSSYGQLIVD